MAATNNDDQETVACVECKSTVLKTEYEEEFYSSWKSMETNQILYVCQECFEELPEKPVWIAEGQFEQLCIDCIVLAKYQNDWFRATVCNFDLGKRECEVEFHDEQIGFQELTFNDIKPLHTFSKDQQKIPLMYKFRYQPSYEADYAEVEGLEIADNLIPEDLKNSLKQALDKIAEKPEQDFHPGSDGKVLNLVHPSLFCYVKGVSRLKDGTIENFNDQDEEASSSRNFRTWRYQQNQETNYFGRSNGISKYQWLPTNFYVNGDASVSIQGYINGLTPKENYVELYKCLENVFSYFVPMLEHCLGWLYYEEDILDEDRSAKKQKIQELKSSTRNRSLQVFVKAANYVLQPGQTHEGVWHVEGVCQEHIIATGIYYYEVSENLENDGLQFRRGLTEDEEENIIMEYTHENPPPDNSCVVELGSIHTKQDRCVLFPNSHQHKLLQLHNKSDTDIAVRKMLCFFIVDPDKNVISTEDVPDQNWKVAKVQVAFELQKVAIRVLGKAFPNVVAQKILGFAKVGFSLEESQENRLALMRHRRFYKDQLNREIEREINLCEH
eukprot:TRINITY_DN1821_c1_g3_i1.p1 TRINITY_DN1821_c1_g3~~TRINITY_DN1821_c1_g3_i1.p1  ORF type:complete len:555 (+),score=74.78 TRINITY_DN1821_c1_g3_i1:68-1732(+)